MRTARPLVDRLTTQDGVVTFAADGAAPERKFRMLAYTGAPVKRFWGMLVIDLDGLDCGAQKKPILLSHDTDKRAGYSESITRTSAGLEIAGRLLDNEVGREIQSDSKQGFPFQASVGVAFDAFEEVGEKAKVTVNGQKLTGPLTIARKSRLLESSFVTLGADGATSAEALSRATNGGTSPMSDNEAKSEAAPAAVTPEEAARVALEADRARLAGIVAALPGRTALAIERFLAGDSVATAQVIGAALAHEVKSAPATAAAPAAKATEVVPFNAPARSGAEPQKIDLSQLPVDERAEVEFKADAALRTEFESVEHYKHYLRAASAGRVKICEPAKAARQ